MADATPSCGACAKRASDVDRELKLCAKCKSTHYCSRECQKADWKTHKRVCASNAANASRHAYTSNATDTPRHATTMPNPASMEGSVLIISLGDPGFLDDMYGGLFASLSAHASLKHARVRADAVEYLNNNTPTAILVTDPAVCKRKNSTVLDRIKTYVSGGGTAIFACMFTSFIRPPDFDVFFRNHFDLPWKFGNYQRTMVHLNPSVSRNVKSTRSLPESYSQKAVFLENARATDGLYLPSDESELESLVFTGPVRETDQPAVAWAKIGDGWLGYVGDVNGEEGSEKVILAMCGI